MSPTPSNSSRSRSQSQSRPRSRTHPYAHAHLPHRTSSTPPAWAPNIFYSPGSLVWHEGSVWRCDSPHTSGSLALEPTQSHHLWTPLSPSTSPINTPYGTPPLPPEILDEKSRIIALTEDQSAARQPESLRDELSGTQVWRVGSVGVLAYSEDGEAERLRRGVFKEWSDKSTEKDWLNAARARTAAYRSSRLRPLVRWELVEGSDEIPEDALVSGEEGGERLFSARVWLAGGVHVGKCSLDGAEFTYGGEGRRSSFFEVLCGEPGSVEWIPVGGQATMPGCQWVEGGREGLEQTAVLVARARYDGDVYPGKCLADDDHASIPYRGGEDIVSEFEILAHASLSRR